MIPVPVDPIKKHFEDLGILSPIEVPKRIGKIKKIFSYGEVSIYQGEAIEKFINFTVKGLNLYHYDFGIAYPTKEYVYPVFFYQVIFAPQRVLVVVHYAFEDLEKAKTMVGMEELLEEEVKHEDLFLTEFPQQDFLQGSVVPNRFNGLIRQKEGARAYGAIAQLFAQWHRGMLQQGKSTSKEEIQLHQQWFKDFRRKFYQEDYGFAASKRYLGEKWSKEVFEKYLFNL